MLLCEVPPDSLPVQTSFLFPQFNQAIPPARRNHGGFDGVPNQADARTIVMRPIFCQSPGVFEIPEVQLSLPIPRGQVSIVGRKCGLTSKSSNGVSFEDFFVQELEAIPATKNFDSVVQRLTRHKVARR